MLWQGDTSEAVHSMGVHAFSRGSVRTIKPMAKPVAGIPKTVLCSICHCHCLDEKPFVKDTVLRVGGPVLAGRQEVPLAHCDWREEDCEAGPTPIKGVGPMVGALVLM